VPDNTLKEFIENFPAISNIVTTSPLFTSFDKVPFKEEDVVSI
jgi:hypothetical protein